jgi:hypothetical protein
MKSTAELTYESLLAQSEKITEPKYPKMFKGKPNQTGYCHYKPFRSKDTQTNWQAKHFSRKSCSKDCLLIISNVTGYTCGMKHSARCDQSMEKQSSVMLTSGIVYGD